MAPGTSRADGIGDDIARGFSLVLAKRLGEDRVRRKRGGGYQDCASCWPDLRWTRSAEGRAHRGAAVPSWAKDAGTVRASEDGVSSQRQSVLPWASRVLRTESATMVRGARHIGRARRITHSESRYSATRNVEVSSKLQTERATEQPRKHGQARCPRRHREDAEERSGKRLHHPPVPPEAHTTRARTTPGASGGSAVP